MRTMFIYYIIPGYYCDVADTPVITYTSYDCPKGYYCPNGTKFSTQYPCPAGTYNPTLNRESLDQCTQCDTGKYCETTGLQTFTGIKYSPLMLIYVCGGEGYGVSWGKVNSHL